MLQLPAVPENWPWALGALAGLVLIAWIASRTAARLMNGAARRIAERTRSTWDDRLIERRVFVRVARVVPALIVYYGIGPALTMPEAGFAPAEGAALALWAIARRLSAAYVVLTLARAFKAFLDAVNDIYNQSYADAKSRPVKGYLQVISLLVYIAAGIVAAAVLLDRSPLVFLSGLGALAAVLMLVFKDTILSLVASVQIMSNDMIRIGDWVSMPQANSDGDVIDIALHTVKVQNWDKTISTIPTHKFISESFKNWRGMSESGGRRIKRSLSIDMNSVRFLDDDDVEALSRREALRDYMRRKREELSRHNATRAEVAKAGALPGGGGETTGLETLDTVGRETSGTVGPAMSDTVPELRRLTNLGTFRAYVYSYLKAHAGTHKGLTLLVRQLAPGPQGVPIEVYCFAADTAWASYESLQGDIFDHLIAVLPEFDLRVFQSPAGGDLAKLAEVGSGGRAEQEESPSSAQHVLLP